jgi:pimeloyl-ACP methyl ester carboxylesterase
VSAHDRKGLGMTSKISSGEIAQDTPPALLALRQSHPPRQVEVAGLVWDVIDTGAASGSGETLVLLPGAQGTAALFYRQVALLRDAARLLAVSYPAAPDAEVLADGLAGVLDALGVAQASVLGSSYGAYLAQLFATRQPSRVRLLFVTNSFVDVSAHSSGRFGTMQLDAMPAAALKAGARDRIVAQPPSELRSALLAEIDAQPAEALKAHLLGVAHSRPLGKLPVPDEHVVVIDCADDPVVPAAMRAAVAAHYPGGARHTLEQGGHYPYIQAAEAFAAIVREHL